MNLFKKVTEFFAAPPDSIEPLFELLADQQARIEQIETFSWESSKILDDRGKQIADYLYPSPAVSHGRLKGNLRVERLFELLADQQARIEQLEAQIKNGEQQ